MTRVLELCAGYGGLSFGLALAGVDEEIVAVSEVDKWANLVLDARFDCPNLGDIKAIDWKDFRDRYGPIDILTAGYPCQPFSTAGRRLGEDDPRHLWPYVAEAIRVVRPRLAFLENVRGHVSKGLDNVVGDLSSLGYVGAWGCLRASDVGAAHRRERVFILAADPDAFGLARAELLGRDGDIGEEPVVEGVRARPAPDPERVGDAGRGVAGVVDGAEGPQRDEGGRGDEGRAPADDRGAAPADADGPGRGGFSQPDGGQVLVGGDQSGHDPDGLVAGDVGAEDGLEGDGGAAAAARWGKYAPAIVRWEGIIGRTAPIPAIGKRLNPEFVEWLMGLPERWVTGVDGISRSQQLKILGNGVVPQQAAVAFRLLLGRVERVLAEAG